jgi:putative oxidoreductase
VDQEELQVKQTSNIEHRTSSTESTKASAQFGVGRWTLDVRRFLSFRPAWRILDFIIGAIFIYAGVIKALDPVRFANDIDNYKTIPWFIGVRLAFYLPWLEIFCGVALILRFLYRGGLSILTSLTGIFIAATVAAKVRGLDITCGCFGHASQHWSFSQHLALDLAIFGALLTLYFSQPSQKDTVGQARRLPD